MADGLTGLNPKNVIDSSKKTYKDLLSLLGKKMTNFLFDRLQQTLNSALTKMLGELEENKPLESDLVEFQLKYTELGFSNTTIYAQQFVETLNLGTLTCEHSRDGHGGEKTNYTFDISTPISQLYIAVLGMSKNLRKDIKGISDKYRKLQVSCELPALLSDYDDIAFDIFGNCLEGLIKNANLVCAMNFLKKDAPINREISFDYNQEKNEYFENQEEGHNKGPSKYDDMEYLREKISDCVEWFCAFAGYPFDKSRYYQLTCITSLDQLVKNVEAYVSFFRLANYRAKCKDRSYVLELLHKIIAEHPFMVKFLNGEEFNDQLIGMSQPEGKEVKRLAEVAIEKYGNNPTYHFALDCDDDRKQAIINYFNAILKSDDEIPIGKVTEENGFIVIRISNFLALIDAYHKEKMASYRFDHIRSEENAKVDEYYKKHPDQERKVKPLTLTKLDIPNKIYYGEYYK